MLFEADTQRALFFRLAEIWKPTTDREWFDLYFTSFFSVWLDHQRRYGQKKYVAGFTSMLALEPRSMTRFRQVYPDGWLISILREPFGWYASVKHRAETDEKTKRSAKKRLYGGFDEVEAAYLDNIKSFHANRDAVRRSLYRARLRGARRRHGSDGQGPWRNALVSIGIRL